MKRILIIFILIAIQNNFSQEKFNDLISRLYSTQDSLQREAIIDTFITKTKTTGIPHIEGNNAYFIYRGKAKSVSVAGDFTGWSPNINLSKISNSTLWFVKKEFESNARLDYKLVIDGSRWILDPLNPNLVPGGFGYNSELAMPDYIQPWEINPIPQAKKGKIETKYLYSSQLKKSFRIDVYLPPDYDTSANYPAIYISDGNDYLKLASMQTVTENLLHKKEIIPFIGVFIYPNDRNKEYGFENREQYSDFFANGIVPFIDSIYNTIKEPGSRILLGTSLGANITGYIYFRYKNLFTKCGLHSPAFWVNDYEVKKLFENNPKQNLDIWSVWGTYESVYEYMRPLKNTLEQKGYKIKTAEYPEGHSWGLWRATIDDFLKYFLQANPSDVRKERVELQGFKLLNNYPNPFNPDTTIRFEIYKPGKVSLVIRNVLGQIVNTAINKDFKEGSYSYKFKAGNLSSGIYFYTLTYNDISKTKKMLLIK